MSFVSWLSKISFFQTFISPLYFFNSFDIISDNRAKCKHFYENVVESSKMLTKYLKKMREKQVFCFKRHIRNRKNIL